MESGRKKAQADRTCCVILKFHSFCRRHLLFILTTAAVIVGFSVGFIIRHFEPNKDALQWIGMPGELYLRMLKLMILPLLTCSVISGTASLDPKSNGKISGIAFIYILLTNALGCVIGIALVYVIKPGGTDVFTSGKVDVHKMAPQDIFADLLRNIVPDNLVESTFRQSQTQYKPSQSPNITNGTAAGIIKKFVKSVGKTDGPNILGLIVACTIIGIAAGSVKERGKIFLAFFSSATEIVLTVLRWFLWFTPIGIASLICASIASINDVSRIMSDLGLFVVTVTVGIVLLQALFLPLILFMITRRNPYTYILSIGRAWMIAFAATSTAVAIPEMLRSCEQKQKIDRRVSRFVIPFCVTLNADGSALFLCVAAVFIANINSIILTFGDVIIIGLLSAIGALALPSVPSSSIVTLVMILSSLSVPAEAVSLLFAVEWFLDRIRTAANLVSHTFCAAVTYQFCKEDLKNKDMINDVIDVEVTHNNYDVGLKEPALGDLELDMEHLVDRPDSI